VRVQRSMNFRNGPISTHPNLIKSCYARWLNNKLKEKNESVETL
jgi:hypothetical protein